MKTLFIGIVAILLPLAVAAQDGPAKIYLLNINYSKKIILNTPNAYEPIVVKPLQWVIITMGKSDSLGLSISEHPYYIHFDKGKNYYFTAYRDQQGKVIIPEQSEQAFFLSVHLNIDSPPVLYLLDK